MDFSELLNDRIEESFIGFQQWQYVEHEIIYDVLTFQENFRPHQIVHVLNNEL